VSYRALQEWRLCDILGIEKDKCVAALILYLIECAQKFIFRNKVVCFLKLSFSRMFSSVVNLYI